MHAYGSYSSQKTLLCTVGTCIIGNFTYDHTESYTGFSEKIIILQWCMATICNNMWPQGFNTWKLNDYIVQSKVQWQLRVCVFYNTLNIFYFLICCLTLRWIALLNNVWKMGSMINKQEASIALIIHLSAAKSPQLLSDVLWGCLHIVCISTSPSRHILGHICLLFYSFKQ